MGKDKRFLTYEQQIQLLKEKKLYIENDELAKHFLAKYGYYSLISGYKDIFKIEKNGNYKSDASFNKMVHLYIFDEYLRYAFLTEIIKIEKHIKSVYSYNFCLLYGDRQANYLNVNHYNYSQYQDEVNELTAILQNILDNPSRYPYVEYNIKKYGTVPLWVLMNTLTLGNLAKMYSFSTEKLQSKVAREFENIYNVHLNSMLNVLSKFRNVCAHGERLYNYKTRKSIKSLPAHSKLSRYSPSGKNDLFNVFICLKYLSSPEDFQVTAIQLQKILESTTPHLGGEYMSKVLSEMGFPKNWEDIIKMDK